MQEIDEDSVEQPEPESSPTTDQAFHTAPNTPDNAPVKNELMHLSAHATEGTAGVATFSLLLLIGGYQAVALVDSGSSHTFMDQKFALKSNCHLQPGPIKKFSIAGGGHLISQETVPSMPYTIQGHKFSSSFHVLPLETYDVILGIDWMYHFSPVTLDLPFRLLAVCRNGNKITLSDHTQPQQTFLLESEAMQKLMTKSIMGYFILIHSLEAEREQNNTVFPPELDKLLTEFTSLFEESTTLPPARECDHAINLVPGATPPNLRPY